MSWLLSKAFYNSLSGSLPSSLGQGGASLADTFSAGAASVQLSETDTPPLFWLRDKTIKASRLSQFGTTFLPSSGTLGEDLLTLFRAGFPVRTSARPAKAQGLVAPSRAYGSKCGASFARFDPDSFSWKTPQFSLLGDSESFSETWPRWGTMRNGECWQQPTPSGLLAIRALITSESASGSSHETAPTVTVCGNYNRKGASATSGDGLATWVAQRVQTPVADDAANRLQGKINSRGEPKLSAQVKRMPSPRAMDSKGGNGPASRDPSLANVVRRIPTPVASASKGSSPNALTRKSGKSRANDRIDHAVMASHGGQLNPTWVEWLMGWPIGWTALEPLATDNLRLWSRSLGTFSEAEMVNDAIRARTMPWLGSAA